MNVTSRNSGFSCRVRMRSALTESGCGVRSIRFRPPLNIAAPEADAALTIVRRSLKEL